MNPLSFTFTLLALAASPAAAQVAGAWAVSGKIGDTPFTVDCRFEPRGAAFGGACIDASAGVSGVKPGKVHPLKTGSADGRQVRWVYEASFLMARFDVTYSGTLDADRMAGAVTAAGRKGEFTAIRK